MRTRNLDGAVVVVTGASSGVGHATATAAARRGATAVVVARREEPLDRLVADCERLGGRALALPADVTDDGALDAVARTAVERFGRLDGWVNNAAVTMFHRFGEEPVEDVRRVVDVNVMGYVLGARAALPWFREQGAGVLVNVGSVLSKVPAPYVSTYVLTKHAARALSSCLRSELLDEPGIAVCTVMPGAIDTPFFQHAANHTGRALKALRPTYSPERVASAVVSCLARPRPEVTVGAATRLAAASYAVSKRLGARVAGRAVHDGHFRDEPAEPTSGNLHEPMAVGDGPTGGWRGGSSASARRVAAGGAAVAATAGLALLARGRR